MKQPVTALHIFIIHLIVRLVTNTGEFLTALKLHGESELFRLCRTNVEECHWTSENRSAVSVFHDIKLDSLPHMLTDLLLDRHICDCLNLLCQLLMAVNAKITFIFSLVHSLSDHTHQPDNSKHVVYMLVCNEDIVDIIHVNSCIFQYFQNTVPAACIYKEMFPFIADCIASIITFTYRCISGS